MSWPLVKLKDCCSITMGQAPKGDTYNTEGQGYALIAGAGDFGVESPEPKKFTSKPTRLSAIGDIILCIRATIGDVNWSDKQYCLGRGVAGLNPNEALDSLYLWYFIKCNKRQLESEGTGSTFKQVSRSHIENWEIPIPPLPEQKRIAAILDKADQLRQKRQQAITLADDFLRSVFLDMFGDPESKGWEFTTVEAMAAAYKGSMRTGPFGSQLLHSEFIEEGIAVLGIDNAVQNSFNWAKPRFISEAKYQELKRYTVKPDDVIITIMGTCGRCAVVPKDVPQAINTKHLCAITLDHSKCLPRFLHSYFLMHPMARKYLTSKAKGAIMSGLNMGIIKELPIPVVPMSVQQKYQDICEKHDAVLDRMNNSFSENEHLFNALSQKAFAGEL